MDKKQYVEHNETRIGAHHTPDRVSSNSDEQIDSHLDKPADNVTTNILAHLPKEVLLNDVEHFVREYGLEEHRESFIKGALVAQRPHAINNIAELSPEEKDALHYEREHKWSHPAMLYITIFICSVSLYLWLARAGSQY
jgi:hypothetical protein